jgi:hypothetical protein
MPEQSRVWLSKIELEEVTCQIGFDHVVYERYD